MKKRNDAPIMQWKRHGVSEFVRLYIEEFNGRLFVHLRTWNVNDQGKLYPTKRGVTIPNEHLARLRKGLRKAERKLITGTSRADLRKRESAKAFWASE